MNSGVKIDSQVLHFFKGVEVKSLEKKIVQSVGNPFLTFD